MSDLSDTLHFSELPKLPIEYGQLVESIAESLTFDEADELAQALAPTKAIDFRAMASSIEDQKRILLSLTNREDLLRTKREKRYKEIHLEEDIGDRYQFMLNEIAASIEAMIYGDHPYLPSSEKQNLLPLPDVARSLAKLLRIPRRYANDNYTSPAALKDIYEDMKKVLAKVKSVIDGRIAIGTTFPPSIAEENAHFAMFCSLFESIVSKALAKIST